MIKKIITFLIPSIFLWILIVSGNPIRINGLEEKSSLCNMDRDDSWRLEQKGASMKQLESNGAKSLEFIFSDLPESPFFYCKNNISIYSIYRAQTINILVKVNKSGLLNLGLMHNGVGPSWSKPITESEVNQKILLSWPLYRETSAKTLRLNWLPGNYKGTAIYFEKSNPKIDLIIMIYDVYIK